ncbi:serine/threonine-protein kinase [Planctomycetota bacterium]
MIGKKLGPYVVEDKLGRGGMGAVYRARDTTSGRTVALKVLLRSSGLISDMAKRFAKEAEILASLQHPGIVALRGGIVQRGEMTFYAMELVNGLSLAQILAKRGQMPVQESVAVCLGVLDALAAAHDNGVVHRDIKTSNVLLSRNGRVKVVDFGLARAVDTSRLTQSGQSLGTPAYMSPEQADGSDAGPASDLYSTGVVLYECLAGRQPFRAESPLAVLLKHLRQPPPPIGVADVTKDLETIVQRALAKEPADRYPNAVAFARALRSLGVAGPDDGRPVLRPLALVPAAERRRRSNGPGTEGATLIDGRDEREPGGPDLRPKRFRFQAALAPRLRRPHRRRPTPLARRSWPRR